MYIIYAVSVGAEFHEVGTDILWAGTDVKIAWKMWQHYVPVIEHSDTNRGNAKHLLEYEDIEKHGEISNDRCTSWFLKWTPMEA